MADHKPNLSHDVVTDFLRQERFRPTDLWAIVQPRIRDYDKASIIVDDSVQDKRYSNFIDLVKKQYPSVNLFVAELANDNRCGFPPGRSKLSTGLSNNSLAQNGANVVKAVLRETIWRVAIGLGLLCR